MHGNPVGAAFSTIKIKKLLIFKNKISKNSTQRSSARRIFNCWEGGA